MPPDRVIAYEIVDEPADFPGGMDSLRRFLSVNINYPERAIQKNIEGKCYLQFVVTNSGTIENVIVKKGVPKCPECDEESVRVIKMMPAWHPGRMNDNYVDSYFSLPINFKLKLSIMN